MCSASSLPPAGAGGRCRRVLAAALAAAGLCVLAGCIADTAEDSDLPWSANKNWEGMGPLPSMMIDRYD